MAPLCMLPSMVSTSTARRACFGSQACWHARQVSEAGDVLWALPPNFRAIIRGKSWLLRLEPVLAGAQNAAGYVVRVSFGTTLVASIVLVTLTIIAILTASQSSDRDDRRCGGLSLLLSSAAHAFCVPTVRAVTAGTPCVLCCTAQLI